MSGTAISHPSNVRKFRSHQIYHIRADCKTFHHIIFVFSLPTIQQIYHRVRHNPHYSIIPTREKTKDLPTNHYYLHIQHQSPIIFLIGKLHTHIVGLNS